MRKPSPSDLTDERWEILQPLIPVKTGGRPRTNDMREVLNTSFYLNRSGGPWDRLPHDLLPKSTAHDSSLQGRSDGPGQAIRDALRREVRVAAGREPRPRAGSLDSPTVKATESAASRGDDGGQKITGHKRPLVVDTLGLLLVVGVTVASADDGTSVPEVLARLTAEPRPRLELLWADSKDPNHRLDGWWVETEAGSRIEVVSRPPGSQGSLKLPRRWVVERTFAGLGRYRRQGRDDERFPESSEAMIKVSSIHRIRRILKPDLSKRPAPFRYRGYRIASYLSGFSCGIAWE